MRHTILASHGRLAEGWYDTIKMIIGEQPNIHVITAYADDKDPRETIRELMESIPETDEVVCCTDVLGGSVNNEMMNYIDRDGFHLITGTNLPLLLNLFLHRHDDAGTMIPLVIRECQAALLYCNQVREQERAGAEEDF